MIGKKGALCFAANQKGANSAVVEWNTGINTAAELAPFWSSKG